MPHAGVMGTANEFLKHRLTSPGEEPGVLTHMVAGAGAGAIAAAATNPLDVIKTRLQTQHLSIVSLPGGAGGAGGAAPATAAAGGTMAE